MNPIAQLLLFVALSGLAFGTAVVVPASEPVSRILTAAVILLAGALGREA